MNTAERQIAEILAAAENRGASNPCKDCSFYITTDTGEQRCKILRSKEPEDLTYEEPCDGPFIQLPGTKLTRVSEVNAFFQRINNKMPPSDDQYCAPSETPSLAVIFDCSELHIPFPKTRAEVSAVVWMVEQNWHKKGKEDVNLSL
ncbi:hypothetical protein HYU95_05325 [Candidatus Daviesbacteria bacterium]|nr:hypothetical protein [Candidatus Daviesbacteria bacterium]